jgi:hypothetical protein
MCAKTHTIYRNARKGLPEKSGFSPKRRCFCLKMAENARKKAENSQDSGCEMDQTSFPANRMKAV